MIEKSSRCATIGAFICAMFALPATASATRYYQMPSSGTVMVGRVSSTEVVLAFKPSNGGSCKFVAVGNANGLTDNLDINGSSGADVIIAMFEGVSSFCGRQFSTLPLNSYRMWADGKGGADFISGHFLVIVGGWGDDYLIGVSGYTSKIDGGSGRDHLRGYAHDMYGGYGNDVMCPSGDTVYLHGDAGTDTACGDYWRASSVERLNGTECPAACGFL